MAKTNKKIMGSAKIQNDISLASELITNLNREGTVLGDYSRRTLGTEDFNANNADSGLKEIDTHLSRNAMFKNASPSALEAARVVAAAIGNEASYSRVLGTENYGSATYANEHGYGSDSILGTEYFSDRDLAKHLAKSVVLNVRVAEQTPYAEKMYKTMIIDPSDTGATFRAKKLRVHRGARHTLFTDKARKFTPRNAIDALTDPSILKGDDLALVPFMPDDKSADAHFVDRDLFAPRHVTVAGHEIPTSFLNFEHAERNLLALCSNPLLIGNNLLNETDEIAEGMALKSFLVNIRRTGQARADGQFVILNVLHMAFSGLDKTPQGDGREIQLSFRNNLFTLDGTTLDHVGDVIGATSGLASNGYQLQYEIVFNSYVLTNLGDEKPQKPMVYKRKVYDANGQEIKIEGSVKSLIDTLVIEPIGYEYAATLTNENKRQYGHLADAFWFEENYKVRLGDPVTTRTPPNGVEVDDSSRLEDLISLIHIRNENLAVERTIEYTNTLRTVVKSIRDDFDQNPAAISGIGRHFIRPWLEEDVFDVSKVVTSLETKADIDNARAGLVNLIRVQLAVALQRSRYLTALRATSGCNDKQPKVLITTDTVVADLLQIHGDSRLLGQNIECEVVTTNDLRYYPYNNVEKTYERRLQWVLTVDGDSDDYQIYTWGTHLWVPPLVSNTQLTREGATAQELTVQPRNLHVVNCPVTGVITVKGLNDFMKVKKAIAIEVAGGKLEVDTGEVTPPVTP